MKAKELINVPNLRVLEKYGTLLPENLSSCFSIKIGENVEEVMRSNGLSEEEIKVYCIRILKGNPHWVELENKEEVKASEKAKEEVDSLKKQKEELLKLTKAQQIDLLLKLGVDKKKIPVQEPDRVELIIKLNK